MSPSLTRNLTASVRDRLLELSRRQNLDYHLVLTRYALERLLYRLSRSEWRDRFVLKGAMLFSLWSDRPFRSTRDVDFLGFVDSDVERLVEIFRSLLAAPVEPDGLTFVPDSVRGEQIMDDSEYQGVRISAQARLGEIRIQIQADVGFGDAVQPPPEEADYPVLLEFPVPRLRMYNRYAVVAEKTQPIVVRGILNSRMKDYYDIFVMTRLFEFEGELLGQALNATFASRKTGFPAEVPVGLSDEFSHDQQKQNQWNAFLARSRLPEAGTQLYDAVKQLRAFLRPVLTALAQGGVLKRTWKPDAGWQG